MRQEKATEGGSSAGAVQPRSGEVIRPSICTSVRDCTPNDYCRQCSHAIYKGSCILGRTFYRWEHSPQYGPRFSRRKRGECDWTPNERHPVWKMFRVWHEQKFGEGVLDAPRDIGKLANEQERMFEAAKRAGKDGGGK